MVDIEAFPWLVHIGIHFYGNSKPTGRCGGSIITRHLVLTVAHCIDTYVTKVSLLIGDHNVTSFYQGDSVHHTVTSDNFVQHPKYNRMTLENDIGLIRLEKPGIEFERGRIIPICLGVPSDLRTGMKARTMGWGVTGVDLSSQETTINGGDKRDAHRTRGWKDKLIEPWRELFGVGREERCLDGSLLLGQTVVTGAGVN
ncbi:chymotrypsin B-like isoform X3 [Oratosquilla oratoria]|uniref:chymotrypsin B-like isoform X3 n=1 Tax=Oratosquilla oratoria TaxID=337810 RepID=UPI003F767837